MLIGIVIAQAVILAMLVVLLVRKSAPAQMDARLLQLPEAIARLEARIETTDKHLGDSLSRMRSEATESAQHTRDAATRDFGDLRTEITNNVHTLGANLNKGFADFRADNTANAEALRGVLNERLETFSLRLANSTSEVTRQHTDLRESLNQKLTDLSSANTQALAKLNEDNTKKLDEMRTTVDEKLQTTLNTRLTESFGMVAEQLTNVSNGLGEMSKLSDGMQGLTRIFSNVRSRGNIAEVQLGRMLGDILAPGQYQQNVQIKPNSRENVEYAVKLPGESGEALLAIDAKFPREDWERLQAAYEVNDLEKIKSFGKTFESAIRTQAKKICDLYISPPKTTPYAIMFLPTESLYAEVMRRDGLQASIQKDCNVTIAGPSTLSALLISFQMGFHMLNIQKKRDEVGQTLAKAKYEFEKFAGLMEKVEKNVGTVQNTLQDIHRKTKTINLALKNVSQLDAGETSGLLGFGEIADVVPVLAAETEESE